MINNHEKSYHIGANLISGFVGCGYSSMSHQQMLKRLLGKKRRNTPRIVRHFNEKLMSYLQKRYPENEDEMSEGRSKLGNAVPGHSVTTWPPLVTGFISDILGNSTVGET